MAFDGSGLTREVLTVSPNKQLTMIKDLS